MSHAKFAFGIVAVTSWAWVARAQTCTITTYNAATGSADVNYSLSYPGNPTCLPGSVTNSLSWTASSTGQSLCPAQFNYSTNTWSYATTFTSDYYGGGNAGCWNGLGPTVFNHGTLSCEAGGDACREVFVTVLGQYVGVPPVGLYLAGATYYFGTTACWPKDASATVETCTGCTGSPGYACSTGSPVCTRYGWSGCSNGGTACATPPPNWNCGACYHLECGSSGWTCACNPSCCGVNCPIVIDTANQGFHLTSPQAGVRFAFAPHAPSIQVSWTDPAYENGFLVLDRNANGLIDDSTELFGNNSPQTEQSDLNGFSALALFDARENGGNDDGYIGPQDTVYNRLRVWIDSNHNGMSETSELKSLPEVGVIRISLRYHRTPFVDSFGNQFRYRARLWDFRTEGRDAAYDVFLVQQPR